MEIQNTLKSQNNLEKEEQELTGSGSVTSDYTTSYSNQNTGTATKIKIYCIHTIPSDNESSIPIKKVIKFSLNDLFSVEPACLWLMAL